MERTKFIDESTLKKKKGQITGPYTMMCKIYDDVERSTVYCNYCHKHKYDGHKKDCPAYDTKYDFMKQFR